MTFDIYNKDGKLSKEKMELADSIFGIEPNDHAIYLSVKAHLANKRQGTHKSKERSEVRGGGKKPWKQKGRGGARAGTNRSPLWVGGGRIFGPRPRNYRQDLPKKVKKLARKSAFSYKVKDSQLMIVEDFMFEKPQTKDFVELMNALKIDNKKILLLTGDYNPVIFKSGRNVPKVSILEAKKASTYDILNNQVLVLQKSAVDVINNILSENGEAVN